MLEQAIPVTVLKGNALDGHWVVARGHVDAVGWAGTIAAACSHQVSVQVCAKRIDRYGDDDWQRLTIY